MAELATGSQGIAGHGSDDKFYFAGIDEATESIKVTGTLVATPTGTQDVNITKVAGTTLGSALVPVSDGGGSLTVDGTVAVTQPVAVTDNGGSLTVVGTVTTTPSGTQDVNLSQIGGIPTKIEDVAAGSGYPGIPALGVRNDFASALTSSDGVFASFAVDSAGRVGITDLGGSITVDGTFFQATQPVSAVSLPLPTGAATSALQTQPGVDIGDVTINNAAGASAVNIQDGGNSITVDGTVTITPSGTQNENLAQVNGVTVNVGTGAAGTGTQRVAVASDSSIILAAGAATIGSLAANQSVNVAQINGVAPSMGSGINGTGVQRVSLATDQAALTTAGLISVKVDQTTPGTTNAVSMAQLGANTVSTGNGISGTGVLRVSVASDSTGQIKLAASSGTDIGSLTANQTVNLNQVAGSSTGIANTGVVGAGTQRVTLATDVALPSGTNIIGALSANQSVNVAQINGVTTTMGNGVSGTGVQRVTLASDSTGQVTLATGANTIGALTANQTVDLNKIAGTATEVGQGTGGSGSLRVAEQGTATATLTNVASSASSVQLLASTTGRKGATFYNDSTSSCYVKFGTTASATSFTYKLRAGWTLELPKPVYNGRIDAIWDTANGNMRCTEMTA